MGLLPGEELKFDGLQPAEFISMSDEEINQKYIKGEIRIITEQARYPLPSIVVMLSGSDYKLNPEFQRRHRWTVNQKSKLVESFIMNVPIPPIFLYEDSYSHYEVMDGLQRLTAIKQFYQNHFALEGLEEWPELNGKKYNELPLQIRKGIDRRYLSSIILLQETAKNNVDAMQLKQLVFERINSGGVKLEPQESRNAVFNGPLNELCIKLARNKYLCLTWQIPVESEEEIQTGLPSDELIKNELYSNMGDVELVLRFFANRQRENLYKYTRTLKEYLNNYLKFGNALSSQTLSEMGKLFEQTVEFLYELLGDRTFMMYRKRNEKWSWYSRPSTAIYDPLMIVACDFLGSKQKIISKKADVFVEFEKFYTDYYEDFEGRNTNPGVVSRREEKMRELFQYLSK